MVRGLNQVSLLGNVGGKDPEIRITNEGKKRAIFSFATTDSWNDKASGELKTITEWHKIVIFNEAIIGIVEKYVKKGSRLLLQGTLKTRKWVDNAGIERYITEVVLQNYNANLFLLDAKNMPTSTEGTANFDVGTHEDLYEDDHLNSDIFNG